MALDFGQKQKPEQQFREELRILATQIETINQQLAGGTGSGGPANARAMQDLSAKLTFIYEFLKTMQIDLRSDAKASFEEVQKSVNATLQKNLGDIYAGQQEATKLLKATPQGNAQDLDDIRNTLKELIKVYKEEVNVFKQQNEFLQKKLVDIETRLGNLER
jgi:hypothetical protein